jgi:hypothetical protein
MKTEELKAGYVFSKENIRLKRIRTKGRAPAARSSHIAVLMKNTSILIHGGYNKDNDFSDAFILELCKFFVQTRYTQMEELMETSRRDRNEFDRTCRCSNREECKVCRGTDLNIWRIKWQFTKQHIH